jgi:hypothetical protein
MGNDLLDYNARLLSLSMRFSPTDSGAATDPLSGRQVLRVAQSSSSRSARTTAAVRDETRSRPMMLAT